MPITLDQLAPFLTDPRAAQAAAAASMGRLAGGIREDNQLAEHARQHDTTLAFQTKNAADQLAEQTRYHGATIDQGQQQIDAALQGRRAEAIKAVLSAAASGHIIEAKAMAPYLQALGVGAHEMAGAGTALPTAPETQLAAPGAPPSQLAAFAGMPQLSAPALSAPPPAPVGPSGVFGLEAGGQNLGQLDIGGMAKEQQAQGQELAHMLERSSRPQDAAIRTPIAEGLAAIPEMAASPAAFVKGFGDLVDQPAHNLQSGINAQAQSTLASQRLGMAGAGQDRMFASQAQKQMLDVANQANVKTTLSSFQEFEKARTALGTNTNNPTAWALARTAMSKAMGEGRLTEGDIARAGGMDTASASQRINQFLTQNLEGGVTPEIAQNMKAVMDAAEDALNRRAYAQYKTLRDMQRPYLTGGDMEHPMAAAFTDNFIRGEFNQYKWYKEAEAEDRPDLVKVRPGSGGAGGAGAGGTHGVSLRGARLGNPDDPSYAPERIKWLEEPKEAM